MSVHVLCHISIDDGAIHRRPLERLGFLPTTLVSFIGPTDNKLCTPKLARFVHLINFTLSLEFSGAAVARRTGQKNLAVAQQDYDRELVSATREEQREESHSGRVQWYLENVWRDTNK